MVYRTRNNMSRQSFLSMMFALSFLLINCIRGEDAVAAAGSSGSPPLATIEGALHYPDMSTFNITTRITLNHDEYTTYSRADGSFIIYNVPPGIHQLDIHSTNFLFSTVKIQLLENAMDAPKCLEYPFTGAKKVPITHPLVLTAHGYYNYFEKKQGFSFMMIFKNPMFLMMGFSVVMMFIMPKMMENMEPEEKERMQKQMEMQKDPTKMFSELFGGLTGDSAEDETATIKNSPSGTSPSSKKSKRR